MTSKQFRAALRKLELTPNDIAKLLNIGLRTVYNYLEHGVTNPPTAILMTLLVQKVIVVDHIIDTHETDFSCTEAQAELFDQAYANMTSMTIGGSSLRSPPPSRRVRKAR